MERLKEETLSSIMLKIEAQAKKKKNDFLIKKAVFIKYLKKKDKNSEETYKSYKLFFFLVQNPNNDLASYENSNRYKEV